MHTSPITSLSYASRRNAGWLILRLISFDTALSATLSLSSATDIKTRTALDFSTDSSSIPVSELGLADLRPSQVRTG